MFVLGEGRRYLIGCEAELQIQQVRYFVNLTFRHDLERRCVETSVHHVLDGLVGLPLSVFFDFFGLGLSQLLWDGRVAPDLLIQFKLHALEVLLDIELGSVLLKTLCEVCM